jgi:transcriptional regulator with GAF, ATPase, and Fis domain
METGERYLLATKLSTVFARVSRDVEQPGPLLARKLAHVIERAVLLDGRPTVQTKGLGLSGAKAGGPVVVGSGGRVLVDFSSAWKRSRAAQLLGTSKGTLRYRMEQYQLRPPP